jgi:hypothetical protein
MNVLLEEKIKEAILAVRWKQSGDGPSPNYFESTTPGSFKLEATAASFLAGFIMNHISNDTFEDQDDSANSDLDNLSLEVIASYLENKGYTVSLPD